jgi:hypothetical protein
VAVEISDGRCACGEVAHTCMSFSAHVQRERERERERENARERERASVNVPSRQGGLTEERCTHTCAGLQKRVAHEGEDFEKMG